MVFVEASMLLSLQHLEAIAKLPEQMAGVFQLKYLEGKKLREIADIKQISENTVKTQLQRARDKLRKILLETSSVKFIL